MYKSFNTDMTIGGYQFEVGKTYEIEEGEELKFEFEFCRDIQDCFRSHGIKSRICEIKAEDIIEGDYKSVCRKITIVRELSQKEIMDKITESSHAFWWAKIIGNPEVMIDKITDSYHAYLWARDIGNLDVMIDRVTDSYSAYLWALNIGNQDVMIDRITDSEDAYLWSSNIGNPEVMIDRITNEYQRKEIEEIIRENVLNKGIKNV